MRRYQSYKDSGFTWLGEVPTHWEIRRLKNISKQIIDGTHFTPTYTDNGVRFLSVNDITRKPFNLAQSKFISREAHEELVKRCSPNKGDILLSKNGTIGVPFVIDFDDTVSLYVSLCLIKLLSEVSGRYSYYFFLAAFMFEQYNLHSKMTSVTNLHLDKLRNFFQLVPPLEEQKAIAHYLDTKTAQIDRKIDLLTQKSTLYGNLKQALINETVTRGLDKSVSMKDSGIEWIGKVPSHWDVKHFKQFSTMKGRIGWQGLKHSEFINEGPFLITGMNFKGGEINWEQVYHITNERYEQAPEIQLREADILMTKDGTIGKLLFVENIPEPYKASLNSHLLVFRPIKESYFPKYLYYQLNSSTFQRYVEIAKTGTTFFGISQASVGRYIAILPTLTEQKRIAEYLDAKTAKIEEILQRLNIQIEKLKELRKTLINDVVTGKIKVA